MPLSLTSEFTGNDIHTVIVLKQGKVFLLTGNGEEIVIKAENIEDRNVKHFDLNKKAMGSIDSSVKASKKLSDNELQALLLYISRQKTLVQQRLKDRLPGAATDLDQALSTLRDRTQLWFKMPKLSMMNLKEAIESRFGQTFGGVDDPSKTIPQSDQVMRTFLAALKKPTGLEMLGQVIAADCFNGNEDRVVPNGATGALNIAGHSYKFRTIQNIGNLMIVERGPAKTISGQDFADPNSALRSVDSTLSEHREATPGGKWTGDYIVDPIKRKKFAADVIWDLEYVFNEGRQKTFRDKLPGNRTALGSNAAKRLETGMVTGAHKIASYILERINNRSKTYPSSFTQRATLYKNVS